MKNFYTTSLVLFLSIALFSIGAQAQVSVAPSVGDGSLAAPFEIANFDNLVWVSENTTVWGQNFIQTADIDASFTSDPSFNGGLGWSPIGTFPHNANWVYTDLSFYGVYNGQGHTISNLYMNRPTEERIGLFGRVGKNSAGLVTDVHLINVNINALDVAGAVVGQLFTMVDKSSATGTVSSAYAWAFSIGGIAGQIEFGSEISLSSANVSVIGTGTGATKFGGFCGTNGGTISNSYAVGSVTANAGAGGFVGDNSSGIITNCYSTGTIVATTNGGGFVSINTMEDPGSEPWNPTYISGTITSCFWDTETSGLATSDGGTAKTTLEMKTAATFTNWNFSTIWSITPLLNSGYPDFTTGAITEAPTASAQTFCSGATVANLVATGTDLQWYDVETAGTALASTTVLATGNYFVSQTVSGSESTRTSVAVTITTPPALNTTFSSGGLNYIITSPTTVAVGNNSGASGSISIPPSVTTECGTYAVTSIGNFAFFGCTGLTSVTIGNSVSSIGGSAFNGCTGLTSVTIGNSVASIGSEAFRLCTSLTSVTIGNSVTSIGLAAFHGCSGLTTVTIPNSVSSIGQDAFMDCTGLTSVTIPNSVSSIGDFAFYGCTGLTSVTIGNSVSSIGDFAFYGCTGLTSVTIGNSVSSIGNAAFRSCTSLSSVTIGNSVSSIGQDAFMDCTGLTSVVCEISTPLPINSNVFTGVNQGACSLTVPNASVSAYQASAVWQDFAPINCIHLTGTTLTSNGLNYVITSPTTVAVGDNTGASGIISIPVSITLANSCILTVTSIGNFAFFDCTGLTSVTIGNSVSSIGDFAFYGCTGLTSVTIGNSVSSIGNAAFRSCTSLSSVTIGNSVSSIGQDAFMDCTGLTSVVCEISTPLSINSNVFTGVNQGACSLTVPNASVSAYQAAAVWQNFAPITCASPLINTTTVTACGNYTWANNGQTYTVSGTYTGTTTNCITEQLVFITATSAIVLTPASQTNISCFGGSNGAASVTSATGGAGGYTYNWTPGNPTGDGTVSVTGLTAGTWTCTVTDSNSCTATQTFIITQPAVGLSVNIGSQTNVLCFGDSTGIATASSTGGTGTVSFVWSNGQTSSTATGLVAGTYTVTGTDANGCTSIASVTITQPTTSLSLTFASQTNINCFGGSNGAASVTSATGGAGGYTYNWTPGNPTGDGTVSVTGLTAGTWTCTVTDSNSCTATQTFIITQPAVGLSVNIVSQINVLCFGDSTGIATASSTGGTGTVSFVWSNGQTSSTATGLVAGTYTVTGTDANGCTSIASVTITQPASALNVSIGSQTNVLCFGNASGSATATSVGGTGAIGFVWSNGQTSSTATSLVAGVYTVTGTDANGCTSIASFTITQPASALNVSIGSQTNVLCFGNATGTASATSAGGNGAVGFVWSNGQTTSAATGLVAGTYTVTGTDANGCTSIASVTITQPASTLIVSIGSQTNVLCFGNASGSATATSAGGTGAVGFVWSNGQTTSAATGLVAGTYTVTGTDANGCTSIASVTITQPLDQLFNTTTVTACASYTWADNSQTYTTSGTYTGTTTNCVTEQLVLTITSPPALNTTFSSGGLNYVITSPTTVTVGDNTGASGSISIPASVTTECGTYAVTSIGDSAFNGCTGLISVTIPNSVTSIGQYAFYGCTGLTTVIIPDSVTTISQFAFYGCSGLISVTIGNSVTSIGLAAFHGCSGLTTVTIPNSVTSIGYAGFALCTSLTSVTIGNSVISIGNDTFAYCSSLTSVVCAIVTPLAINSNVFFAVNQSACSLAVPNASVAAYQAAAVWQNFAPITCASPLINTTTVTACGNYTWANNSQTYTTSGTYTGTTTNCVTEQLVLTITTPPAQPSLACYETAVLNTTTCTWDITGTQPPMPTSQPIPNTNYSNLSAFTAATVNKGHTISATETFDNLNGFYSGLSGNFGAGSPTWTASATGGLFCGAAGGSMTLSTNNPTPLTLTFNPGVTGLGANIFVTDSSFNIIPGTITVTFSNGSTNSFSATSASDFFGATANSALITSVSISSTNTANTNGYVTVDNLVIATGTLIPTSNVNYSDLSNFSAAAVTAGHTISATETFDNLNGFYSGLSGNFGAGSPTWTASATGGLFCGTAGGSMTLSTNNPTPLTLTFNPGVTALGANIFITDSSFNVIPGTITVTFSNGDTNSFSTTMANDFFGAIAYSVLITSISISSTNTANTNGYVTVDNLVIATGIINPTLACYQSYVFNSNTCAWDVTGLQPLEPTTALACYETRAFNTGSCSWVTSGTQPAQPTLACYETATFNTTSCVWDVTATSGSTTYYADVDGDGFGDASTSIQGYTCLGAPAGYVTDATDCNDAVAAINPGHVEVLYNGIDDNCDGQLDEGFQLTSSLQSVSCGATLSAMGSLVYTDINLSATAYRFKVVNNTTGDIQYVDNTHQWFALNWLASYEYATAYSVSVQLQIAGVWVGYYGSSCVVNSPDITSSTGTLQLISSQCGATSPSIATVIYTTAQSGATGYRFRITDVTVGATGSNLVQVKERSYHWFTLPMLSRYNYGSTYMVEVAVKTTGGYTGYGSPCYVNTPASPMLNNCGAVIPTSRTLVYTAITKSVSQYRFQVTKVSDQSARTFDTSRFWFSFKVNMPGYTPSVAYSVRVAVMTAGTWSPFGDACEITSPAIPRTDGNAIFDFDATVFPNPYSDQFGLLVNTDSYERIAYKVYDMLGKLIEAEEFEFTALETKEFGRNYPAGVYNIIVSQGEERKTLRVIKR